MALSSATKVFETYEVLENILYQLPLRDLTRVQRVCSHWQSLITASTDLQRKLFLLPDTCGKIEQEDAVALHEAHAVMRDWYQARMPNPPKKSDPDAKIFYKAQNTIESTVENGFRRAVGDLHPLLTAQSTKYVFDGYAQSEALGRLSMRLEPGFKHILLLPPNQSFERMYLSRPPITKMQLTCSTQLIGPYPYISHGTTTMTMENPLGLRLGEVCTQLHSFLSEGGYVSLEEFSVFISLIKDLDEDVVRLRWHVRKSVVRATLV